MQVESIHTKTVVKKTGNTQFKGRLFYAIVPNQTAKNVVFYFSKSNEEEARSVVRALPLFIKDYFGLEPSFFCSSDAIADAMEGDWNYDLRTFLTLEEKDEQDKFEDMEDMVNATKEVFISENHQKALAMEGDNVQSVTTQLTKDDAAPPSSV